MASWRSSLIVLALVTAVGGVFSPVLSLDFVSHDDPDYVTENPVVQEGLSREGTIWAFQALAVSNWHPMTWMSHMLDWELYGDEPWGHHLTSLLFHCANTVLLFLLMRWMTGAFWRSAFVAALFALHPMRVESVAWISERKDVMCAFFWLLGMAFYIAYARGARAWAYAGLLVSFVLGLLSKPMIVTLPCALLLLDYWPLRRLKLERRIPWPLLVEKLPLFGLVVISSALTVVAQQRSGAFATLQEFPLAVRLGNAMVGYPRYLGKLLWPRELSPLYLDAPPQLIWVVLAFLGLLAITLLSLRWLRERPYLAVGWFWFVGTLVPVIGLVQVGSQSMADRYTYIPAIGLSMALVWGISEQVRRWCVPPAAIGVSCGVVLLSLSVVTRAQTGIWQNGVTLFEHAIELSPRNHLAHTYLGSALALEGEFERAAQHHRQAIRLNPRDADAYRNLGAALSRQKQFEAAIQHYRKAIQLDPRDAQAHFNLGASLEELSRPDEALIPYRNALKIDPAMERAHYNLGVLLATRGLVGEAADHFREAVRIRPGFVEAHNNLGNALTLLGRFPEAERSYREAIRLDPHNPRPRANLERLLARKP